MKEENGEYLKPRAVSHTALRLMLHFSCGKKAKNLVKMC